MNISQTLPKEHKWLYPIIYGLVVVISMIPPYAEKPFAPQDTQDVIINLLMVSVNPYKWLGPIFHIATILIVLLIAVQPARMGRVLAAYMGLNYLVIAFVQTMATTVKYGFVLQTGGFIADAILGVVWIVVAIRGGLDTSFKNVVWHRYLLLPLAGTGFLVSVDFIWCSDQSRL